MFDGARQMAKCAALAALAALAAMGPPATAQTLDPLPPGDPMAVQSRVVRPAAPTPTATQTPATPQWRLSGTLVRGEQRTAIVNGQTVGVGDRVNGALVERIAPGEVTLRTAQRRITLTQARHTGKSTGILTPSGPRS